MKFFSYKNRPVHLSLFPQESLKRTEQSPDLSNVPALLAEEALHKDGYRTYSGEVMGRIGSSDTDG